MRWSTMAFTVVTIAALALAGCGGTDEETEGGTGGEIASLAGHPAMEAETHKQPKDLEAMIEIDTNEMYFANPQGEKNPTFKLPVGKTVGIHIHNDGTVMHELVIGRKFVAGEGYSETLNKLVPADLFFYYGDVKAEAGDALLGELEIDPSIKDVWLRMEIPPDMAGEWEIGCFAEGHYEAGMHETLVFE